MNVFERFKEYEEDHCWQYEIRQQNLNDDIGETGLAPDFLKNLRTSDFYIEYVPKTAKKECEEIKHFIERHEWLGKLPVWITHRFAVRLTLTNHLAGVVIMATPNAFSNLLGKENRNLEKLISRGACISWSPKNLASWMIMKSIRWMVNNTEFRYFTAYSDPEAKELGTIYQACNFHYLGQTFGGGWQYFDHDNAKRGWFGSSGFSDRSQIVRYAKKLNIPWNPDWYRQNSKYRKVDWSRIPEDVKVELKTEQAGHKARCDKRKSPPKHKYCYILGKDKRETRKLKKLYRVNSPDKFNLEYPKERGGS